MVPQEDGKDPKEKEKERKEKEKAKKKERRAKEKERRKEKEKERDPNLEAAGIVEAHISQQTAPKRAKARGKRPIASRSGTIGRRKRQKP